MSRLLLTPTDRLKELAASARRRRNGGDDLRSWARDKMASLLDGEILLRGELEDAVGAALVDGKTEVLLVLGRRHEEAIEAIAKLQAILGLDPSQEIYRLHFSFAVDQMTFSFEEKAITRELYVPTVRVAGLPILFDADPPVFG